MATRIMSTHALHAALQVEGFALPENCREVRLIMGVDAAMVLQFDVFLTDENLARLGRAFLRMSEKEKKA